MVVVGSNDIGEGLLAIEIDHDPTVTATDAPAGSLIIDANGDWWRKLDDGSTTNVVAASVPITTGAIPIPEFVTGGSASSASQGTLQGGAYILTRPVSFNRLHWRIAGGATVGETVGIFIYQAPDGGGGVADLVATMSTQPGDTAGNLVATPSEGTVTLQPGIIYIVYGRDDMNAAGPSIQTFTVAGFQMLNQNVPAGLDAIQFTTAILASAPPATLDPSAQTPVTSNLLMITRLETV